MDLNIAITNEHWSARLEEVLFGPATGTYEPPTRVNTTGNFDLIDALVLRGVFPSRSQARKAGWAPGWPLGWTDVVVGKKRLRVCIWNPVSTPAE